MYRPVVGNFNFQIYLHINTSATLRDIKFQLGMIFITGRINLARQVKMFSFFSFIKNK